MYKLFNKKQNHYVQKLVPNYINKSGIASCGFHFEDITFQTKKLAEMDAKSRISYKDLVVVKVEN